MANARLSFWKTYLLGSAAVCGFSKIMETWDVKVERTGDLSGKRTDMLMGEKFTAFLMATVTGPIGFPVKTVRWMDRLDIYMKGHKPSDYGICEKKNVLDYMSIF